MKRIERYQNLIYLSVETSRQCLNWRLGIWFAQVFEILAQARSSFSEKR